jgi:hypothetical protein
MVTNALSGNARGIAWFRRPSGFVAILALLSIVAMPRRETSVVVAKENERATAKAASVLDSVNRTIGKEPKYSHKPKYSLVVLGTNADAKLWMVEDGETLYLDKNLNGDLTDDGPPIARGQTQDLCDYKCRELTPIKGPKHTDFCLRRWNNGEAGDNYGLSLAVEGTKPMYAGWFGTFWSSSPEAVPIIQFGGPLTPTALDRSRSFVLGSKLDELDIGFCNDGLGKGATSYLSTDALPEDVVPKVEINWPVAPGAPRIRTTEQLTKRCCYWNYYTKDFHIPSGVVEGEAVLTISLPKGEMPFPLASKEFKVPVRAKAGK